MKRFISISVCILYSVLCIPLFAQSYATLQDSVYGAAQVRTGADFDLHFNRVTLNFGEELRFNLAPSQEFQMANTTVGLNVSIVKGYFSAQAAYTLRARINKLGATNDATLTTSTDANKVLRHRVSFGLTEQIKVGDRKQWGFSLKERAVLTKNTTITDVTLFQPSRLALGSNGNSMSRTHSISTSVTIGCRTMTSMPTKTVQPSRLRTISKNTRRCSVLPITSIGKKITN